MMKTKKKILAVILIMAVLTSLAACGDNKAADSTNTANNQSDSSDRSSKTEQSVPTDGKVLVAYFAVAENSDVDAASSASVSDVNGETKGRMTALAEMIQEKTGGDLFSIKTSVKYPGDGGKLVDYAQEEQDQDARPEILYSFFDEYDFSGKTIIPFNSHNGSQFSGTIETIQKLEPDAAVITDGFTVNERDVPNAKSDMDEWLSDLGY